MTSNKRYGEWGSTFGDPIITLAKEIGFGGVDAGHLDASSNV